MNGLPDPRDRLKRDMVNLYSKYIMGTKPTADVRRLGSTVAGQQAVNWGEPELIEEEDEDQTPAQAVSEEDETEDQVTAQASEDEEDALAEEGEEMAGLSDVKKPEEKKKKSYDEMILEELEAAKLKLLEPKKLSIADILGAGNMRRSAALIRETEKENEERQMKARELALDILGRRSTAEKQQRAAEELAQYRRDTIAARLATANRGATEPAQIRIDKDRAIQMYPDLPPDKAYQRYVKEVINKPRPAARPPSDPLDIRMGMIAQMRDTGVPRKPTQAELNALKYYEERQKRGGLLDSLFERYMTPPAE